MDWKKRERSGGKGMCKIEMVEGFTFDYISAFREKLEKFSSRSFSFHQPSTQKCQEGKLRFGVCLHESSGNKLHANKMDYPFADTASENGARKEKKKKLWQF